MRTYNIQPDQQNELANVINKIRLENKNCWYQLHITTSTNLYKIKGFNTWLQLIYVYNKDTLQLKCKDNSPMDLKPTQFKEFIKSRII